MILGNVPYIRLWANIFNGKAKTNRKDFAIDFLLQTVVWLSVFCSFFLINDLDTRFALIILWLLAGELLLLSLVSRRLNDAGYIGLSCFLTLIIFVNIVIYVFCFLKKSEESENNKKDLITKAYFVVPTMIFAAPSFIFGLLSVGLAITTLTSVREVSKDIKDFDHFVNKTKYADEFIPDYRKDIGDYSDIQFGYKRRSYFDLLGYQSEGITLVAKYDNNKYSIEKQSALEKYNFLEEPVFENDVYIFPVTTFEYEGFVFKIAPKRDYRENDDKPTCKSFLMVGHNDSESKIAYLYFYDYDIDLLVWGNASGSEINERMPKLIEDCFVWF